jgi:DNA polymerase-3 subunit delta'
LTIKRYKRLVHYLDLVLIMFFSDVTGQEDLKKKLVSSVNSGRIPHAQLFYGPEGSGALPLALAYAQYVACTGEKGKDSCGKCPSCMKFARLAHPDLHFSFPVNTTRKIVKDPVSDDFINEWRELLINNPYFRASGWYNHIGLENKQGLINKKEGDSIVRKLSLKPYESDYKIMVIWLPEKMHSSTANMLLKLIEEPPVNTLFLLVSEDPGQLLPTISSRTQAIKLEAIPDDALEKHMTLKYNLPAGQARDIVRLSGGNYIRALEILETTEENELN